MNANIRRAGASDSEAAATLMIAARHAAVPAIPAPIYDDAAIRRWFTTSVMAEQGVWVAVDDEAIDAVLVLGDGWIEHLYVDPTKCGLGIGSALVDRAKSLSDGEILLWTFESNVGARRFYERHGFVPIDSTPGDNEEGAPDIKYRWRRTDGAAAGEPGECLE